MKRLKRWPAAFAGLLTFLASFAVLVPSLAPGVPGGHDSGEVLSAAVVLGVPHPPGYPLYAMLGHLWTYLPVGSMAYRLNLFSGFCLALAAGFLAAGFSRVTSARAGSAAALLYCFAMSPWRQGAGAEVFSLHLCILSALLMAAICWVQAEGLAARRRWMLIGCFIFGLGAAHHHTIVLAVPGVLGYMILNRGRGPWGITWYAVATLLLVGFGPYAYLYIRAQQEPPMNWGDCSNFSRFKDHVLRKAYGSFQLNPSSGQVSRAEDAHVLAYFASVVRNQFPFPLVLLLFGGLAAAVARPTLMMLFGWVLFAYGAGFALLAKQPPAEFFLDMSDRFYSSSYVGAAGFIALCLYWIQEQARGTRWYRLTALFPLLAVYTIVLNWPACSQRGQYHPEDHMLAILDSLPQGAILCVDGDLPAGEYDYTHYVLKHRTDVVGVFPGLLPAEWYRTQWMPPDLGEATQKRWEEGEKEYVQAFVDICRERGLEVFLTSDIGELKRGQKIPEGLVFRYLKEGETPPDRATRLERARKTLTFLESRPRRGDYRMNLRNQTFWTRYAIGSWVRAYRTLARDLYPDDLAGTELALRRALEMDPVPADWLDLAELLFKQKRFQEASEAVDRVLAEEPESVKALQAKLEIVQALDDPAEVEKWRSRVEKARSR